jgi:hypothetical protein
LHVLFEPGDTRFHSRIMGTPAAIINGRNGATLTRPETLSLTLEVYDRVGVPRVAHLSDADIAMPTPFALS